jgi:hypothetical protein
MFPSLCTGRAEEQQAGSIWTRSGKKITMRAEGPPDKICVDEEYNAARKLSREEFAPVISRLLSDKLLIVVPPQGAGIYKEVADAFSQRGGRRIEADTLTDADLRDPSFWEQRTRLHDSTADLETMPASASR